MQQKINDVETEISELNARLKEIVNIENHIQQLEIKRFQLYEQAIIKTIQGRIYLQNIISKFDNEKNDLDRLSFQAKVSTRTSQNYIKTLLDRIHKKRLSEEQVISGIQPILAKLENILNGDLDNPDIHPLLEDFKEFGINLLSKTKETISHSDFHNALLNIFFTIGVRIEFDGKGLSSLSMGERAVVLLKILLSLDDTPLLIDQPEEHLDNRYIFDQLVPAFRKAKAKRQIIIATHNANLVVNTDAEQIIIAEHVNGKQLTYKVTTLENLSMRDEIKKILEGGDEAFKKREEKYGYII